MFSSLTAMIITPENLLLHIKSNQQNRLGFSETVTIANKALEICLHRHVQNGLGPAQLVHNEHTF
jgi:hypothetical protein